MNLNFTSFLKVFLGSLIASLIFWAISFLLPKGIFGKAEQVLDLQEMGLLFGGLFGGAMTIIGLVVHDSHHPETGGAANFSMVNGVGSMLIGKSITQEDGSYLTTEWFSFLWIPLLPICNYRVFGDGVEGLFALLDGSRQLHIKEKHPVRLKDVAKGYLITVGVCCIIGLVVLLIEKLD